MVGCVAGAGRTPLSPRPSSPQPTAPPILTPDRRAVAPAPLEVIETYCVAMMDCEAQSKSGVAGSFPSCVVAAATAALTSPTVLLGGESWDRFRSPSPGSTKCGPYVYSLGGGENHAEASWCAALGRMADVTSCLKNVLVTCRHGFIADLNDCAASGMTCKWAPLTGGGACVRPGCTPGNPVECHDGWIDTCDGSVPQTIRHRCPGGGRCTVLEGSQFTCSPVPECSGKASCVNGVNNTCVGGEAVAISCASAGWECTGGSNAACDFPTTGPACLETNLPTCIGTASLSYCLNGHRRQIDCRARGATACVKGLTFGDYCGNPQ